MFNIFVRAVIFGLGVEIGRDIYRKVKQKTIERERAPRPEQPSTSARDEEKPEDKESDEREEEEANEKEKNDDE